jgi:hypothetical protein
VNNASVNITKAITLKSQNGRDLAIIDGNYPGRTNRCVYMTSAGATVDGFTIRNGYSTKAAALYGAGVYMTSGILINSAVVGNTSAYHAAGVYMTGGCLTNCSLSSNVMLSATDQYKGCGLYMTGGALTNCQIVANDNRMQYSFGSGVYMSGGSLTNCTISGNISTNLGRGAVCIDGGILAGCTISSNIGRGYNGGGIFVSGASTVSVCTIWGNTNSAGGGIYLGSGASVITGCLVAANTGTGNSGGIYQNAAGSLIVGCVVSNNTGAGNTGGGIHVVAGRVADCVVVSNRGYYGGIAVSGPNTVVERTRVEGNTATGEGAGVVVYAGSTDTNIIIRNCTIVKNNSPGRCGGLSLNLIASGGGVVSNCTIAGNTAVSEGGGVKFNNAGWLVANCVIASNSTPSFGGGVYFGVAGELRNCLIVSNVAGGSAGVHVQAGSPVIQSCTITRNASTNSVNAYPGGVMSFSSTLTMTNCIIYGNYTTYSQTNWATTNMSYCCTYPTNGLNGSALGNTQADPKFVDAVAGDFQLQKGSPCIDKGLNQDWMTNAVDRAGNPRILNNIVDMGAYEYRSPLPKGTVITIQ